MIMDNFQTEIIESDLEMDINFQTENRDYSLGKRHRQDNFQTEIVESDLEMDINFQTENRDYSLGKRHREDEKEVSDEVLSDAPELFGKRFIADPNRGDMLMEVFRVEFLRGGDLSGKILIHDNSNTHKYIYRSDHSQYIKDGGDLLLTGLNRAAISIDSTIAVFWDLNLTNPSEHQPKRITNCMDCFDADDHFFPINSQAECFTYFFQPYLFDIPLYEELEDEDGQVCATVTYAFFHEAMQADVEVSLVGENIKGVYGSITAKNDVMVDPHCESFLFLKDSSESVEVVDGQPIPLSRSVVAVPVKSNLTVCAHLKSKDTDKEFKEDVSFGVELRGKSEKLINSIQVRVTWKRYWDVW